MFYYKSEVIVPISLIIREKSFSDLAEINSTMPVALEDIFFIFPIRQHDNEENIGFPRPTFTTKRKPLSNYPLKWRLEWKGILSLRRRRRQSNPMIFLG